MKNLRPSYILILGSLLIFVVMFVAFLVAGRFVTIEIKAALLFSLGIASLTYLVFYFLLRYFFTEKLKILYRSIRTGKFQNTASNPVKMNEDIIEQAEIETKKWADERFSEISKLKEQEKFRREFLGNLAHELKTPVFSIQGYILTLLDGGLEDEAVNRTFLERASKATDRMTAILEDLDQLSKMEVNEIQLDLSRFDLTELVKEVFEELEMRAKKKKIRLRFSKDYDPVFVRADRAKIAQVLTNLISNSIYYGNEKGETSVRFYILDDIITVEVSDNGPGIEASEIPRIFERFYRVEKSRDRNKGGSGLGLAIAKKIIETHGQTINVRSTIGVGSTFTFSLDKAKNRP